MEAYTQCLEVGQEVSRLDIRVEKIGVAQFAYPRIFDNGEDTLAGLALGGSE